jgi:EAL domain-containing protein (putative c-di-GMP-specific phosphodiesterase class I)
MGVDIALDDFGTGYSNLANLRRLPVSILKLDRSFTQGMQQFPADPVDLKIVEGIVSLAHSLNLAVTVEGVETGGPGRATPHTGLRHGPGLVLRPPGPAGPAARAGAGGRDGLSVTSTAAAPAARARMTGWRGRRRRERMPSMADEQPHRRRSWTP